MDLISKTALLNDLCEDREEGTFCFTDSQAEAADKIIVYVTKRINAQPSVPAVPLETLAKWITENLDPRYRDCEHCSEENACFDCPIMTEQQVKEKLGKWMEEQDEVD
ncbi:MAG: hypothetical protein IIZ93_09260 [Acidaminococcaceae bacterium]|nr:hypothetical protein [Acidaminococcaceae bacterium]